MDDIWTVAEANAKFSEVLDRALSDGPQTIRATERHRRHSIGGGVVAAGEAGRHAL